MSGNWFAWLAFLTRSTPKILTYGMAELISRIKHQSMCETSHKAKKIHQIQQTSINFPVPPKFS